LGAALTFQAVRGNFQAGSLQIVQANLVQQNFETYAPLASVRTNRSDGRIDVELALEARVQTGRNTPMQFALLGRQGQPTEVHPAGVVVGQRPRVLAQHLVGSPRSSAFAEFVVERVGGLGTLRRILK